MAQSLTSDSFQPPIADGLPETKDCGLQTEPDEPPLQNDKPVTQVMHRIETTISLDLVESRNLLMRR